MKFIPFKEFVQDWLVEQIYHAHPIFEMAVERKVAFETVLGVRTKLLEHFIKVALFPDSRDVPHWKQEISAWIREVDDIYVKPKSRKLKYSDYWNWLYDGPIGHDGGLEVFIKKRSSLYGNVSTIPYGILRSKLSVMYEELCDDLALAKMDDVEKYCDMLKGI